MSGSSPTKCRLDLDQIYLQRLKADETSRLRLTRNNQMFLSPPGKVFTDYSKAVLLLWIIFVIYVLCLTSFLD